MEDASLSSINFSFDCLETFDFIDLIDAVSFSFLFTFILKIFKK